MAIKVYKRNNAGRRNMSVVKVDFLSGEKPVKSLLAKKKSNAGRSLGKISVRHQGGGHKQRYRIIDFKQDKFGIPELWPRLKKIRIEALLLLLSIIKTEKKDIFWLRKGFELAMR